MAGYATVKRTDLFFRQAVGRVVRRRPEDPGDLVATVFMPSAPTLKGCAERVEVELRQQVSEEVDGAFEVEPPLAAGRRADFQALDADVALAKLADLYPETAERLRIPASVEAIGARLEDATSRD